MLGLSGPGDRPGSSSRRRCRSGARPTRAADRSSSSFSGMFAMSPIARTPGNPATVKSGATSIRPPLPCFSPLADAIGRGHEATAPDDAAGLDRRAVRERHVARPDLGHARPQPEVDVVLVEHAGGVRVALVGEHREERVAVIDDVDAGPRGERRELVDHRRVDHLGQGAGDLDPGRAAADDHEVDRALVDAVRVPVGLLERLDDPGPEAVRVLERVERERVLGAGGLEEVRLGARREDDVVAPVRLARVGRHGLRRRVDRGDLAALRDEAVVLGGDAAQRDTRCRRGRASTSRPGRGAAGTGGSRSCRSG